MFVFIYCLLASVYSFQVFMQFHEYVGIQELYWLMTWLSGISEAYNTKKYLYLLLKDVSMNVFPKQKFESIAQKYILIL